MVYTYIQAYICEMNDNAETRDGREESGLFCYLLSHSPGSKVVIWSRTWVIGKYILPTLGQPLKKFKKYN